MSEQPAISTPEHQETKSLQEEMVDAFGKDDDEFETWKTGFIERRLGELEPCTRTTQFDFFTAYTSELLGPTAEVKALALGRGFLLDDDEIYHHPLDRMREFYTAGHFQEPKMFSQLIIQSVQYGIQGYFGNVAPSSGDKVMREERLWKSAVLTVDDDTPPSQPRSIRENKSEAMCAERAAVAHNMLKLLGWDSIYYAGKLSIDGDEEEMHAFVIFENSKGQRIIYDPMNPELAENSEGKIVQAHPSVYAGGEEILSGNPATASHHRYRLENGGHSVIGSQTYKYFSNSIVALRA